MRTSIKFSISASAILSASALGASIEYVDNGRGPVPLYLPSNYDGTEPLPLIISLHGYSDPRVEEHFNFSPHVDSKRFLYCVPTGTQDLMDASFWNATDACCDFFNTNIDDSGYLRQLVEIIQAEYAVDELSIHFTGISNGGFMTYRMACDHADLIASIAALAGTTYLENLDCNPSSPVHVLHIHGTADSTVLYDGGCIIFNCYPGANESINTWAGYNKCDAISEDGGPAFNLDWNVPGNETTSTVYQQNCDDGATVELWTMEGSEHVPNFYRNNDPPEENLFATHAIDWLLAHRKRANNECIGDINIDGIVSIHDLISVLAAWGSNDTPADIDLDGTVGVLDLSTLINFWGPCP